MTEFPTTLADINPSNARLWHILCEGKGWRFYLGTALTASEADAIAAQYAAPMRRVFITDKNDSTRIHGTWAEMEALGV